MSRILSLMHMISLPATSIIRSDAGLLWAADIPVLRDPPTSMFDPYVYVVYILNASLLAMQFLPIVVPYANIFFSCFFVPPTYVTLQYISFLSAFRLLCMCLLGGWLPPFNISYLMKC